MSAPKKAMQTPPPECYIAQCHYDKMDWINYGLYDTLRGFKIIRSDTSRFGKIQKVKEILTHDCTHIQVICQDGTNCILHMKDVFGGLTEVFVKFGFEIYVDASTNYEMWVRYIDQ